MYDSPQVLLRQIRLGEDTSLEFKEPVFRGQKVHSPKRDEIADEIAAIANTADGVLVLGVNDRTRDVVGVPLDKLDILERWVFEICNDSIKPRVNFRSFRMELPDTVGDQQAILKIEIPRSLFVHKSPGGYFHRQGSSKREMSPEMLARLFQQRSQAQVIRFDEQAVPGTTRETLDETMWARFLVDVAGEAILNLRKMKILTMDGSGEECATVAGILLCSRCPSDHLPGALIEAVHYRGTSPDANYQLDAQTITGPIDQQIRDALSFVRRNMTVGAHKDPGRVETPQYSLRAVFEAIVNAVAHRDYSIYGSRIRLFLFDDRLECYSPGPLPNSVTVESLALRQVTRNELVTSLLARSAYGELGRTHLMEKRGEGVPIILRESRELSGHEPAYRVNDNAELQLTIWGAVEGANAQPPTFPTKS